MRRSLLGVWTSLTFLLLIHVSVPLSAFQPTSSTSSSLSSQRCSSLLVAVLQHKQQRAAVVALRAAEPSSAVDEQELAYLKQELSDYLELRKEVGADTLAKK